MSKRARPVLLSHEKVKKHEVTDSYLAMLYSPELLDDFSFGGKYASMLAKQKQDALKRSQDESSMSDTDVSPAIEFALETLEMLKPGFISERSCKKRKVDMKIHFCGFCGYEKQNELHVFCVHCGKSY
jgi:hypothetical protein